MHSPGMYASKGIHKVYEGKITIGDHTVVTVNGHPLPFGLEIDRRSPTGLTWGYGGAGPAQLSIALLLDAFGPEVADKHAWMLKELTEQKMKQKQAWVLTELDLWKEFLRIRAENPTERSRAAMAAIEPFYKTQE